MNGFNDIDDASRCKYRVFESFYKISNIAERLIYAAEEIGGKQNIVHDHYKSHFRRLLYFRTIDKCHDFARWLLCRMCLYR